MSAGNQGGSDAQGEETVYRDRKGRKLDSLQEFMKIQDMISGKIAKDTKAKDDAEWGKGTVQKDQEREKAKMLAEMKDTCVRHQFDRNSLVCAHPHFRMSQPICTLCKRPST